MAKSNIEQVLVEHNEQIQKFCREHNLDVDTHFTVLASEAHPVAKSASRKFRILAEPMLQFVGDLGRAFGALPREAKEYLMTKTKGINSVSEFNYNIEQNLNVSCPVIWTEKKEGVMYFPNLPCAVIPLLNKIRHGYLVGLYHGRSSYAYKDLLNRLKAEDCLLPYFSMDTIDKVNDDLGDDNKQNAWLPIHRGIRRLGRRHTVNMERAFNRLLMWNGKHIGDLDRGSWIVEILSDTLRSFAKPPTVKQCSTIDDYVDMYTLTVGESPGSCMDSTHGFGKINRPNTVISSNSCAVGGRPIDWYHFCPITTGHYLCRGSVVLARTFTYEYEDKKVYTRVYGSVQAHKLKLIDHLKSQGYRVYDTRKDLLTKPIHFNIPYYLSGKHECMPLPYFDWTPFTQMYCSPSDDGVDVTLVAGLGVKALKDVVPDGGVSVSMTSTQGYWFPDDKYDDEGSSYHECCECGEEIDVDNDYYTEGGVDIFCSDRCLSDGGWWVTYNMSSTPRMDNRQTDDTNAPEYSSSLRCRRPISEVGFVHIHGLETTCQSEIDEFRAPAPTLVPLRRGFANSYIATRQGRLLSTYSCAISEDEHFLRGDRTTRITPMSHIMSHGKDVSITNWCIPKIDGRYGNFTDLRIYCEPDNSRRYMHTDNKQHGGIVNNYFHILPIRVPIDMWKEQVDISKPYPLLTKRALFSLSNPTINVESMIASHVAVVKKHYANFNDCNCTQYLNPIISKEDI